MRSRYSNKFKLLVFRCIVFFRIVTKYNFVKMGRVDDFIKFFCIFLKNDITGQF